MLTAKKIIESIMDRMCQLHEEGYICIKNVSMNEHLLSEVAEHFGSIIDVGEGAHSKNSGKVFRLSNEDEILLERDFSNFGTTWHHDYSDFPRKGTYTFLYAIQVPSERGGTLLMNMQMDNKIEEVFYLSGIDKIEKCFISHSRKYLKKEEIIKKHPVNNNMYIYLGSESFSKIFFNNIIIPAKIIFTNAEKHLNIYKHRWSVGDLLIWDNRIVSHKAEGFDSKRYKRIMLRCAVN